MTINKTQPTSSDVQTFIATLTDGGRRQDAAKLINIMQEVTGVEPILWGPSIIGFGSHHYVYESGREGDMPIISFSPRKQALVLYGLLSVDANLALLVKLGCTKQGKGCVYIQSLSEVDEQTLRTMLKQAFARRLA